MTDRLGELRQHLSAQQAFVGREERSMRWLELGMAITAIAAAALLAITH